MSEDCFPRLGIGASEGGVLLPSLAMLAIAPACIGVYSVGNFVATGRTREFGPLTLAGLGALVLALARVACWIPARRAALVDPLSVLRAE